MVLESLSFLNISFSNRKVVTTRTNVSILASLYLSSVPFLAPNGKKTKIQTKQLFSLALSLSVSYSTLNLELQLLGTQISSPFTKSLDIIRWIQILIWDFQTVLFQIYSKHIFLKVKEYFKKRKTEGYLPSVLMDQNLWKEEITQNKIIFEVFEDIACDLII